MLTVAALINLLGVPAGLSGNELVIRFGLRLTVILVFVVTAIVTASFGFAARLPFAAEALVALVVGFVAQGNFSNLTSGLLAVAEPRYAGATMALYSCIGFGGGFLGTVLFWFSDARQLWRRQPPRRMDRQLCHFGNGLLGRRGGNGASVERRRTSGVIRRGRRLQPGLFPRAADLRSVGVLFQKATKRCRTVRRPLLGRSTCAGYGAQNAPSH